MDANSLSSQRFGPFAIDAHQEQLLLHGEPLRLRPRALGILDHLASRAGHVVTIDELLDRFWPGLAVTPHSVTVIVSALRRTLARDPGESCRIENVYGRGYRFVVRSETDYLVEAADRSAEGSLDYVPSKTGEVIGREPELTRLLRMRDEARAGATRVALIGGDAGIGKSTLVREFTRRTSAARDTLVLTGHCYALLHDPEPYLPFVEILEDVEKRLGRDALAQQMRRFAPTWLVRFPWLAPESEITELRRVLAGTHRGRVLRELRTLFAAIARERNLVCVIEDVHCADAATIDFLRTVASQGIDSGVLLMATYRPLDAAMSHAEILALRGSAEGLETIDLDPWPRAAIESYLHHRFATAFSPGFVADLEHHTRGNPLLVATFLDAMVRDGQLRKSGAEWTIADTFDAKHPPLPDEVHALARQQLALLPEADRNLLEVAATFGDEFFTSDVAAAAEVDPDECADRFAELGDHRLFVAPGQPTSTVGDYEFSHATFRQAILESLPAARSRKLHRQAAAQIEKSPRNPRRADELAEKFTVGQVWNKAADQWERAAARGVQQYAYAEAAACVSRAIEAIEHARPSRKRDTRLADRHLDFANLSIAASGYANEAVIGAFTRARLLAESCQADRTAFRARAGETIVTLLNRRLEEAATHAAALESSSRERPEWRSMTALYVSYVEIMAGRWTRALKLCDEGLRWIARAEAGMPALRDLRVSLAAHRLSASVWIYDDDRWLRDAEEIIESFPSTALEELHGYYILARTAVFGGRNDLACEWATRCLEIADSLCESGFAARARALAAFAGDQPARDAAKTIAAVLASPRELDSRLDVSLLWMLLAELQIRSGDLGAARDSVEEADAVAFPFHASIVWRVAGDLGVAAEKAGFDLRGGARTDGIFVSAPAPLACYARAAKVARKQRATRLARIADEAAEAARKNATR